MKDYPSFPNVFRAGSATSVNLLQSSPSNRVTVSNFSDGNVVGCAKTGAKKFQDAAAAAEINNCMSYRNNSMSLLLDPRKRNTAAAGAGRSSGLDNDTTMDYGGIPEPPTTDTMAHMKYLQSNTGLESDLNSSFNSLNESTLPPPTRSACTRTTTNERNSYLLWVITPVAASISVAIVVAALAGPQWLYTEERVPNNSYSGVPIFDLENDEAFVTKYTKSSLWILCYTFQGMKSYNCVKIDCFPEEQYRPDPQDSTLAIPYTIVKSAPFFLVSGGFLLISFIVFLLAACTHQNSLYYFTSGILFIVSGLLMLIGLIAYISIFKAEIGSKLRPKSTLQPPPLKFTYGHSFFMYVFGFVSTEFVGVLNIFLFISLQQVGHHKTIPCLSFMNNQDKVKDLEKSSLKRLHEKDEEMANFVCKKHPLPTNLLYTNDIERRYYFEKPPPCGIHSKDVAKSLNELYTEPAPTFSLYELPQEFPLTRSVSTATDIYSNKVNGSNNTIDTNPSTQFEMNNRKRHHVNNSKENINDICGLSRGLLAKNRKTKDELFNEFCKRAGDRPKPKDIYFIEDNGNQDEDNIFIVDNYATLTKNRRSSFREPRKRNTTSTLPPFDKIYPKSLFDLDRCESEIWNNCPDQYFMKNKSQDDEFYQNRTLPRCFMKRNFESSGSGINRSSTTDFGTSKSMFSSNGMLHKSTDEINFLNYPPRKVSNTLSVQWPATIPTSPSTFSTKSSFRYNSDYPSNHPGVHKMKHRFTFEDQRSDIFDSFDLDEIERERRKSHASLFDLGYDIMNGTAV